MEPISDWLTCCMPKMRISPMRIWTPVLMSWKTYGIFTLCRIHLNIESETIKQRPTLTLLMEFWDFWWVTSVQEEKQCGLANWNNCENWIQTSSHCNTGIPFTLWLVFSDDVAVFMCAGRSRGWDCDGKAWRWGTEFSYEEFDACHQNYRPGCSTACVTLDDPKCKALDNKEVVRIEIHEWETTGSDTKGECTPCWSRMDWVRAS